MVDMVPEVSDAPASQTQSTRKAHPGDEFHHAVRCASFGWNVFGVIVIVFLAVAVASIVVGLIASGLGSVGRSLLQWAVNAALAPIPALGASVLYFALRRQPSDAGSQQPSMAQ